MSVLDTNLAYGCNCCGALLATDIEPQLIPNGDQP